MKMLARARWRMTPYRVRSLYCLMLVELECHWRLAETDDDRMATIARAKGNLTEVYLDAMERRWPVLAAYRAQRGP